MKNKEIQGVLKIWLEEAFKLKGYTPLRQVELSLPKGWKRLSN